MKYKFISSASSLLLTITVGLLGASYTEHTIAQTKINLPRLSGAQKSNLPLPNCHRQPNSKDKLAGLTLTRAICIAVERHPRIAAAVAAYAGQSSMVDAAKSGYYPQVSVSMRSGRATHANFDESSNDYVLSPKISMQQMVYDFGKVSSSVDEAEAQTQRQRATLLAQIDDIINRTGEAVINVLRLQELESKTIIMIANVQKITNITNYRATAGLSSQSDFIQARARLEAAEANLLSLQTDLKKARINLRTLLGAAYQDTLFAPVTSTQFDESLFRLKMDPENIPSIIMVKAGQSVAEAQLAGATADLFPTVSLEASTEKTLRGDNPNTGRRKGTYNYIGITLNQSLFSGGGRMARRRSAAQIVDSAAFDIEAAMLDLNDQAQSLREYIMGAQGRLKVLATRKTSIILTQELYQEQYKLGSRPVLDLLNAEQEMYLAEAEEVNALYDMWIYYMNYIVITGNARQLFQLNGVVQASLGGQ